MRSGVVQGENGRSHGGIDPDSFAARPDRGSAEKRSQVGRQRRTDEVMRLTKRPAAPAAEPETTAKRQPAAPQSTAESEIAAKSIAAAVEVPAAVPKPRVSRRLTRPADDCNRDGLLKGKKALVFGVANDHSIAW